MRILHLASDGNFINGAYDIFEKYYPNQNLFLVNKDENKFDKVQKKNRLIGIRFNRKNYEKIYKICQDNSIDKIFLHGLLPRNVSLTVWLLSKKQYKIYWIFWGYDLYWALGEAGKYELIDHDPKNLSLTKIYYPGRLKYLIKQIIYFWSRYAKFNNLDTLNMIINHIDFFCFWNYNDYLLLQKHYTTNIKFKFFSYIAQTEPQNKVYNPSKKVEKTIIINHQASITGNHNTIFKKISLIDPDNTFTKICPLSYGTSQIRKNVIKKGKKFFKEMFKPIVQFMPSEQYTKFISSIEIAIFGARRQEAAGNIILLLESGAKVFLREDNNTLNYYREKGYYIYSFENDLNSIEDLKPLTPEMQLHNWNVKQNNVFYYDQFMPTFFDE